MEEGIGTSAGREHIGILLQELRRVDGAVLRLVVVGQRIVVELLENGGIELDAARRGVEAHLAVAAQLATLVLAVGHLVLDIDCGSHVTELELVGKAQVVDEVLDSVVVNPPLRIECLAELEASLGIGQGLARASRSLREALDTHRGAVMREGRALALGRSGQRQEHVTRCLSRRRHEGVDGEAELERLEDGIVPTLGLCRGAGHQVIAAIHAKLDGVRLARLHRLEREVGMRVEHHTDIGGILVQANDLVLQLRAELLPAKAEVSE